MKITKKQLRRIIKEERAKLLNESVSDMGPLEEEANAAAARVSGQFLELMSSLYDEDPEMFAGRSSKREWAQQVNSARADLEETLIEVMNKAIEEIEMNLHDGAYHMGNM